jgi:protocatechuate 3,4-dioxygenase beta subunit
MKKIIQLLLITAITIISSCKKNEVTTTPDPVVPFETGKTITTVVAGKVTAQDGTPLNNVEIAIGTSTTVTDADGNFIIPQATLSEKAGFIKATKAGYFGGSRTINATEKVVNNVVIQLVKKVISGDFTNANGGTVVVATGGSVVFPANAVVTKSGAAYTGTVKVSAYFLDPTSDNCYKEMPGDLRGISASNNEQILTSYGMMAVELNGSNDEPLQLTTGKNATVTFPIAAATQSDAPATIPLWFFDETKGMWVEQGTATKTGNNYVGTVSHFTWWNCDWGGGPLTYTATFVDQNGNPLSNYHVYFVTSNGWGGGGGHGWTASDGSLTGRIPANKPIVIKVMAFCGNTTTTIYTATVGPFTQNTNAGTITVTLPTSTSSITIKGTVVDCSNNPVANGYALIKFNNNYYYTNVFNGLFNKTLIYCSTSPTGTATVNVFDLSTLKKNTTPSTVNITGSGVFNIGQTTACGVQLAVHYTATFVDQNGVNLTSFYVNFSGDSTFNIYAQTATINTLIPANKIMKRKVYVKTTCGGYVLVDSTQIGPFATDFNAGTITVTAPQPNTFTISGTAKDCNNNPVASGYVAAQVDGQNFSAAITNGNFIIPISRCSTNTTTATVIVLDNNTQQQNSTPITVSVLNANVNVGTVQACGINLSEFLNYTFDSTTYSLDSLQAYQQNLTYITGFVANPYSNIAASFNGLTTGTYLLNVNLNVTAGTYFTSNNVSNASVNATITEYGNVGQYIAGTFTGNLLKSGTTITKPISGSFRIKRTQ